MEIDIKVQAGLNLFKTQLNVGVFVNIVFSPPASTKKAMSMNYEYLSGCVVRRGSLVS